MLAQLNVSPGKFTSKSAMVRETIGYATRANKRTLRTNFKFSDMACCT